jgi:hypothetical protein
MKILREEILQRFLMLEVMAEPTWICSNFIHGFSSMPVRIPTQGLALLGSAGAAVQSEMQPALPVRDVALHGRAVVRSGKLHSRQRPCQCAVA